MLIFSAAAAALLPAPVAVSRAPAARMAVSEVRSLPVPQLPRNAQVSWALHKFGGASLATPELYKLCSDLLIEESRRTMDENGCVPTMAIVSARGGVTDRLIKVVEAALSDTVESERLLKEVSSEQIECVRELAGDEIADEVGAQIIKDADELFGVIRAVAMLRTVPGATMELVTGYGEIWSAMTMQAYLRTQDVPSAWLDARDVLIVEQSAGGGLGDKGSTNTVGTDPMWEVTADKVVDWFAAPSQAHLRNADCKVAAPIVVVTGFVASTEEGAPTTLKRSGSDYSATIFARLMEASGITMWKNVNGVYTADPRVVPEAYSIPRLKYDEAIELAYFGAQVPCPQRGPNTPHPPSRFRPLLLLLLTHSPPPPSSLPPHPTHRAPCPGTGAPPVGDAAVHRGQHPDLRARRLQPAARRHRHRGARVLALRDLRQARRDPVSHAHRPARPADQGHHVDQQGRDRHRRGHRHLGCARPRRSALRVAARRRYLAAHAHAGDLPPHADA